MEAVSLQEAAAAAAAADVLNGGGAILDRIWAVGTIEVS